MTIALTVSPEHIPANLVRDIDPWELLRSAGKNAHERAGKFHQEFPRIFYATKLGFLGGVWVPRLAADIRSILQDHQTFSSASYTGMAALIGETWNLLPVETDPPMHTLYRSLLNPLFSPKRMAGLEPQVRDVATRLISEFVNRGECNFNEEFALVYPIEIFLRLMGWPVEMAPQFSDWARTLIKTNDPKEAAGACRKIADFVRGRIDERRRKPTDDFTSFVVTSEIEGRLLTEDEAMGMCFLVFIETGSISAIFATAGLASCVQMAQAQTGLANPANGVQNHYALRTSSPRTILWRLTDSSICLRKNTNYSPAIRIWDRRCQIQQRSCAITPWVSHSKQIDGRIR
jgi:hypothetical protein